MSYPVPKNCIRFKNHNKILAKDINHNRPLDQVNVETERTLNHSFTVRRAGWRKWGVYSTTSYEMSGDYHRSHRLMGGKRWAETDLTGLIWEFKTKTEAENFQVELINDKL